MNIATIVGARPQFVKAAVVSRAMQSAAERGEPIRESIIHTGQHYDHGMSRVFFEEMDIPQPACDLGVRGLSHGAMTGRMLESIEGVFMERRPDRVLVYGDTNSTLAGVLAAAKLGIPAVHVEAGLRSFNRAMPEEINRVLTDHAAGLLFYPTAKALDNLAAEGIRDEPGTRRVVYSGDVMFDAFLYYQAKSRPPLFPVPERYALATLHRAENTSDPERLAEVVRSLDSVAERLPVVLPLHPRTKAKLEQAGLAFSKGVRVAPTVGYLEMLFLLKGCTLVLTDSGGLQKEAFYQQRPCVTLRTETEWTELVDLGVNRVAGTRPEDVVACMERFYAEKPDWSARPYGDGNAADIVVEWLCKPSW